MNHIDLFSGIGGFGLSAQQVWGEEYFNVCFCEVDKFCQEILKEHFGNDIVIFDDIKTLTGEKIYEEITSKFKQIDLLTAGVPCQPSSQAGKRRGTKDDRWLWSECVRIIQKTMPKRFILENVHGFISIEGGVEFESVLAKLEAIGYEVGTFDIPACALNGPHQRRRIWIVGSLTKNPISNGPTIRKDEKQIGIWNQWDISTRNAIGVYNEESCKGKYNFSNPEYSQYWDRNWVKIATNLCGEDDGISARVDGLELSPEEYRSKKLTSLGNSIVVPIAVKIMKVIKMCN